LREGRRRRRGAFLLLLLLLLLYFYRVQGAWKCCKTRGGIEWKLLESHGLGLNFAKNYYKGIAIDSEHELQGRKNNSWAESGGKVSGKKKKKKKKEEKEGATPKRLVWKVMSILYYYSRDTKNDCLLRSDKVACPIPAFVSHVLNI
jgi:hypothetical protein